MNSDNGYQKHLSPVLAVTRPLPATCLAQVRIMDTATFGDIIFIKKRPPTKRLRIIKQTPMLQTVASSPVIGQSLKLYQRPASENPNQVYRTQLAASLMAFQQKKWQPLNIKDVETSYVRCKSFKFSNDRPSTSCSIRGGVANSPTRLQQRPKSVPVSSYRPKSCTATRPDTPADVRPGKFDTMSPQVISDLTGNIERPTSEYNGRADDKSPFVDVNAAETKQLIDNDDTSTTSGIDSGASSNGSPSTDEEFDFEPVLDHDVTIPQLNLRPEKMDALYIPEPKRGWRQYDFDVSNTDMPAYEFPNLLPEHMNDLDLSQMARNKWQWRNHVGVKSSKDPELEGILDRLVEFERLQIDTVEWEHKKASQLRKAVIRRNESVNSLKIKDKRCDSNCLQATCFGDCPEKLVQSNTCENCRQAFCTGTCREVKYEERMRQPRQQEEVPVAPKTHFPLACSSCQKRHTAKYINANNLLTGASRLFNSTFTRGQSAIKTKDLRPKTATTLSKDVLQEFEKMNIEATLPPRPNTSFSSRPRSRNTMFPGKSFNSQRKISLTDLDKLGSQSKVKSKSATKYKQRPKTAE